MFFVDFFFKNIVVQKLQLLAVAFLYLVRIFKEVNG